MRRFIATLCVVVGLVALPVGATEIHGQTDVFKSGGVSMAWGVLRGPDEARTFIVVRVQAGPTIQDVTVTGRDPFTGAQKQLTRSQLSKGRVDDSSIARHKASHRHIR